MQAIRAVPSEDRQTLTTCECCAGAGRVDVGSPESGTYRLVPCIWCDGVGSFDRHRLKCYRRWKRIKMHHVMAGSCTG